MIEWMNKYEQDIFPAIKKVGLVGEMCVNSLQWNNVIVGQKSIKNVLTMGKKDSFKICH